jgi:hypothetical protein
VIISAIRISALACAANGVDTKGTMILNTKCNPWTLIVPPLRRNHCVARLTT